MDLKTYTTGIQHIGIPTNDIDKTVEFYHKLGFETAFETVNEEANEKVVFLKLGTLVVETYENHAAKMEHGAIDLVDKVRTLKKAYKEGIEVVLKDIDPKEYDWMIIDAYNRKVSDELKAALEEACGQPVEQRIFKSVIMSHTGPGTIGFGRIKKIRY